jgi:membrane protease YdiL (CAAX protease family)
LLASSRFLRSATSQAAIAYAVAFALTFVASTGVVLLVGTCRAFGHSALLESETQRFARSASGLMACALVEAFVLASVALGAPHVRGSRIESLRLGASQASRIGSAAAVLGLVGLSAAGGAVIELLRRHALGVTDTLAAALEVGPSSLLPLALFSLGLAPAFAEELFFRGLLQPKLAQRWGGGPAVVLTAAAFGVFHLDLAQGAVAFVAGLLLGWVAERFRSVRPCIAAHATNNMLFVVLAAFSPRWAGSMRMQPWVLACGVVVLATSIGVLGRGVSLKLSHSVSSRRPLSDRARDPYSQS